MVAIGTLQKCFLFAAIYRECDRCKKPLSIRGTWEPEHIAWIYNSGKAWQPKYEQYLTYCTKKCAELAPKEAATRIKEIIKGDISDEII